jgi:chorismate dehydratase
LEAKPVKISVVSYLNSTPFTAGLNATKRPDNLQITLDIPSVCAQKLLADQVDIGLIPVAMIPSLSYAEIITNFCIAANGPVASVLLVANEPIEQITRIIKDKESRTSVLLARILAKEHWQIVPEWKEEEGEFSLLDLKKNTGAVIIGDRALKARSHFKYVYDLAEEWKKMTGLPFVFACWVANKPIDIAIVEYLETAFADGMNKKKEIAERISIDYSGISTLEYLTDYIQHNLTTFHREGLALFLEKIREY